MEAQFHIGRIGTNIEDCSEELKEVAELTVDILNGIKYSEMSNIVIGTLMNLTF